MRRDPTRTPPSRMSVSRYNSTVSGECKRVRDPPPEKKAEKEGKVPLLFPEDDV